MCVDPARSNYAEPKLNLANIKNLCYKKCRFLQQKERLGTQIISFCQTMIKESANLRKPHKNIS